MSTSHFANFGRIAILGVALGGCQAPKAAPSSPAVRSVLDPTSAVLVFPSAELRMLALDAGISDARAGSGRNNGLLGGEPSDAAGPSMAIRQLDDRQRVINGQVRSNLTIRTRDRTIWSR